MIIQYFSDIHLEFGPLDWPRTNADVLIAAGDIGVGTQALPWLAQSPCPVIYVLGNHEYYSGDLTHTLIQLRGACAARGIHLLERSELVIDGVRFLGATLWTNFEQENAEVMENAKNLLNDYYQIQCNMRPLEHSDILNRNRAAEHWLRSALATPHTGANVVITHHAPSPASWNKDNTRSLQAAYCNNLHDLVDEHEIDLWIHGHVHHRSDYYHGNTRIVCNPRGYVGHQIIDGFDPYHTIEIAD